MKKLTPADPETHSPDPITENIEQLAALFPGAFIEGAIDFDILRQLLGEAVEGQDEKFGLSWPGKRAARQAALTPSTGTLRPAPDESVDWETTRNLMIEGDNLEVLKLLQKSYHGKIKLIYIDPPYNTGNDFIYPDNYAESLQTYLQYTGQIDAEGKKFSTNTETGGRFHTKWLNMMYPRLFLARNLMRKDGVIFVSIDDVELSNLRMLMDNVFGSESFLGCITVVSNLKGRSDDKYLARCHNYLLCYERGEFVTAGVPLPEEYWDDYPETANDGRRYRLQGLRKRGSASRREDRPRMYYPIYVDPVSHSVSLSRDATFTEEVLPKLSDGVDGRWRWGRDTVAQRLDELCGTRVGGQRWDVSQIDYAETDEGVKRVIPKTVWTGSEFANESGTLEVKRLLGKDVFTNPKPIGLVAYMLEQAVGPDDIVLDFFAGSGTTAHAVMLQNATDGGSRRYILVQLPEPTNNPEFPTIADITKERIRRVIASLSEETSGQLDLVNNRDLDRGFRVFKLDSSNIRAWDPEPDNLDGSLLASLDHLKEGRTEEDIFYELLLKLGLDLTIPIECRTVAKKTIYSVGAGTLIACLAESIDRSEIEELALGIASWRDELQPAADTVVVFRDSAFADDVAKTNITAILEQHGMPTVRSL